MNNETEKQISEEKIEDILNKIKKDELLVKSKTYFRLRYLVLLCLLGTIFVTSLFLLTFIIFSLSAAGQLALITFGATGLKLFLILFPWKLLALDVILVFLLGWLLRTFRFGYRTPVIYLLLTILTIIIGTSLIIDRVKPFHHSLLHQADLKRLPLLEEMYENVRRPPPTIHGIYRGEITAISGKILSIEIDNARGFGSTTPIKIMLSSGVPEDIEVGNKIFIYGNIVNGRMENPKIKVVTGLPVPYQQENLK